MTYLVIELKDKPRIVTLDGEPRIFETKQDAFRAADKCKQGLVYPIIDVMKVLNEIKEIIKQYRKENSGDFDLLDELLALTDEII